MPLYHLLVVKFLHKRLSNKWLGFTQGFISAFSELGSAYIFFLFVVPFLTLPQLIGFGMAAGAVESIVLPFIGNPFIGTPLEKHSENMEQKISSNLSTQWMGVIERIIAMVIHISSRGLIYVRMITCSLLPGLTAILTFAAIDGTGYYALLEKWAFDDIRILRKLYLFLAITVFVQLSSFLFFYY